MFKPSKQAAITKHLLLKEDLNDACRLSIQTNWNQTESEWLRLIELNPETCYIFRKSNHILGTATLSTYGDTLAWIGMIIVDTAFRGQGAGQYILKTVIDEARNKGFKIIGLDATDQGRRLYQHYGFKDVCPIDRWSGSMKPVGPADGIHPLDANMLQESILLDRKWSGIDREKLIRQLYSEDSARGLGLIRKNRLRGFTFIRPGRTFRHLGPLVAESVNDFSVLLDAASEVLQGEPVLVDSIRRKETSILLKQHGLDIQRKLMRMTLDKIQPALTDPKLRVAVSFEWG